MKYSAILADPPWSFRTYSGKGKGRSAEQHYDCMSFPELCVMKIPAADDAALFLWVTDPMLRLGLELMAWWGFEYKTVAFTWVKCNKPASINHVPQWFTGMGYWTRANPEMCLLGTRGKPKRINKDVRQLIVAPRREHSRKPDEIYDRIERLVGGPYLEMFARQTRPGWDSGGNEVGKFDEN